jgi:hypothetical protein
MTDFVVVVVVVVVVAVVVIIFMNKNIRCTHKGVFRGIDLQVYLYVE